MPLINHAGRDRLSPLGLILLAVTSVGWGLNFPIMKHLLTEWPPLSSRGLSGIAGAAALALFALARRQKLSVPRPMWLRLLLVSMLTIGGWVAFMGLALLWLNASSTSHLLTEAQKASNLVAKLRQGLIVSERNFLTLVHYRFSCLLIS